MALIDLLGGGYNYVQSTAPSSPSAGEVWLDESLNPPETKVYADVGNGLEWLQVASVSTILTNLDATISSRSSHGDPDPNGYIDTNISSRATPSDTGLAFGEVADKSVSDGGTITLNNGGYYQANSAYALWGYTNQLELQWYHDQEGSWHRLHTEDDGGSERRTTFAISAGQGDTRVSNNASTSVSIRVVRMS